MHLRRHSRQSLITLSLVLQDWFFFSFGLVTSDIPTLLMSQTYHVTRLKSSVHWLLWSKASKHAVCCQDSLRALAMWNILFLCFRSGEISSPDVEIAGGNDEPYFPGHPGLFIGWVKPGSDADRLLSPGCQLTKVRGFFVNTKNYEYL